MINLVDQCPSGTLYNVLLDADLNEVAVEGDQLCLFGTGQVVNGVHQNLLGNQDTFDLQNGQTYSL
jgi:hypothetical protein